jgi:hypothetical protein
MPHCPGNKVLNNCFLNRQTEDCLVVGGEDGMITVYEIPTVKNSVKNVSLKVIIHTHGSLCFLSCYIIRSTFSPLLYG